MSDELKIITEYIEKIKEYEKKTGRQYLARYISKELCITIKEKLQHLEAIDNANPSEAMKCLDLLGDFEWRNVKLFKDCFPDLFDPIKQSLLKAQEQEKVLKVIFEKEVNLGMLKTCKNVEQYNVGCKIFGGNELTKEEFYLLKRHSNND